jgi:hypothetical protein
MLAELFKYLPLIMSSTDLIGKIRSSLHAGTPVLDVLAADAPGILDFLRKVGSTIWPNLSEHNQVQAAAMAVYDPDYVRGVQKALVKLGLLGSNEVDGYYGPKTKAAVTKFQTDYSVNPADGWAGKVTNAALQAESAKKA